MVIHFNKFYLKPIKSIADTEQQISNFVVQKTSCGTKPYSSRKAVQNCYFKLELLIKTYASLIIRKANDNTFSLNLPVHGQKKQANQEGRKNLSCGQIL